MGFHVNLGECILQSLDVQVVQNGMESGVGVSRLLSRHTLLGNPHLSVQVFPKRLHIVGGQV